MALVTTTPVRIDPLGQAGGGYLPFIYGPYEVGSTWYLMFSFSAWKSLDGGLTWAEIIDAPSKATGWANYSCTRIGDTLHVVGLNIDTIIIKTFDLSTGLWNPGTVNTGINRQTKRLWPNDTVMLMAAPNGNLFLVCRTFDSANPQYDRVSFSFWNGVTWSALTQVVTNAQGQYLDSCCVDSSSNCHVWYTDGNNFSFPFPNGSGDFTHAQISPTGVISTPDIVLANRPTGINYAGLAREFGGKLYVPVYGVGNLLNFFVGSPVTAPAWTLETTTAAITDIATSTLVPTWTILDDDGITLFAVYVHYVKSGGIVTFDEINYISGTGNGTWSSATVIYDELTNPETDDPFPSDFQFCHQGSAHLLSSGVIGLTTRLESDSGCNSYYLPYDAPAPVVAGVIPPQITARNTGPFTRDYFNPNIWYCCLQEEIPLYRSVNFEPPSCPIPDKREVSACLSEGEDPPYDQRTDQSIQIRKLGSIVTPVAGSDNLVVTFRVPLGYYGVIRGLVCNYTGTGFIPGSGDIIWRLQIQRRWAKDYGAVDVQLGSSREPFPSEIFLVSGQKVTWYVNVPNTSGHLQVGMSWIICSVNGWIYPMQEKAVMGPRVRMAI